MLTLLNLTNEKLIAIRKAIGVDSYENMPNQQLKNILRGPSPSILKSTIINKAYKPKNINGAFDSKNKKIAKYHEKFRSYLRDLINHL